MCCRHKYVERCVYEIQHMFFVLKATAALVLISHMKYSCYLFVSGEDLHHYVVTKALIDSMLNQLKNTIVYLNHALQRRNL